MKVCNINSNWHWSGSLANSMEMPAGHAVLFFLPLFYKQSSMKNIHDCWQVPVCGLCFSQFSPWKPQMVGIRMTMADIIIQMVLVVADREQWWWCALLRDDDVSSSCETKMNHLTLCYGWIPALIYLSSFFFFFSFIPAVFPSLARAATEVANISRTRFVIKMSPGQTWLENSGWGWVKETHSGLCSTVTVKVWPVAQDCGRTSVGRSQIWVCLRVTLASYATPTMLAVIRNTGKSKENHEFVWIG